MGLVIAGFRAPLCLLLLIFWICREAGLGVGVAEYPESAAVPFSVSSQLVVGSGPVSGRTEVPEAQFSSNPSHLG